MRFQRLTQYYNFKVEKYFGFEIFLGSNFGLEFGIFSLYGCGGLKCTFQYLGPSWGSTGTPITTRTTITTITTKSTILTTRTADYISLYCINECINIVRACGINTINKIECI